MAMRVILTSQDSGEDWATQHFGSSSWTNLSWLHFCNFLHISSLTPFSFLWTSMDFSQIISKLGFLLSAYFCLLIWGLKSKFQGGKDSRDNEGPPTCCHHLSPPVSQPLLELLQQWSPHSLLWLFSWLFMFLPTLYNFNPFVLVVVCSVSKQSELLFLCQKNPLVLWRWLFIPLPTVRSSSSAQICNLSSLFIWHGHKPPSHPEVLHNLYHLSITSHSSPTSHLIQPRCA